MGKNYFGLEKSTQQIFKIMIWKNKIWKLIGYDLNAANAQLEKTRYLKRRDLMIWQNQKIWQIYNYHKKNNLFYSHKCKEDIVDWEHIPVMKKSDFQIGLNKILTSGFQKANSYIANSSGSSGQPFWFAKNKFCHALAWSYLITRYNYLGCNCNNLEARFYGSIKDDIGIIFFEKIKDLFFQRKRFDVFNQSSEYFKSVFDMFFKKKFTFVYGYTNSILSFSKYINDSNNKPLNKICPSLKFVLVTAEMCTEDIRKEISSSFGVPVYREYGASETSIIAIENKSLEWEIAVERLFIEIVNDDNRQLPNGEVGRILVTDLFNYAMPIIRYEIGDLGSVRSMDLFPFLKLSKLQGRISDTISLPSGRTSPGLAYYYISRSIIKKSSEIKQFVVIQKTIKEIQFNYISSSQISPSVKQDIIAASDRYLEPGLEYSFEKVNVIHQHKSGKIQHFFSELK
ncbi:MAG: AMP-binding protein [Candidatus Marinimicrobia bacterium]|nr:AMP-binding protein [Candidatus Neomarinimicrobiota bacterium]